MYNVDLCTNSAPAFMEVNVANTISVEVYESFCPREFTVGEFHPVELDYDTRNDRYQFVAFINRLAKQGLVFHSEVLGTYLFRAEVPCSSTEGLKNRLELRSENRQEYTGGDPLYKDYTQLQLYLDGESISTVDIS